VPVKTVPVVVAAAAEAPSSVLVVVVVVVVVKWLEGVATRGIRSTPVLSTTKPARH